uniref:Ubiquitin-like domain-containing protein n=1 Tax=Eutreptiella gymnastica TaxID=73025 RepID=A0A7S4FFY9_9EUGL
MFVRIKREKVTYFIHANPEDPVAHLKQEICKTETDKAADEMRLLLGEQVLEDSAIIKDCRIENAGLLYLVYKQDDDTWEEVNVFKPVYAQTEEDRQIDLPDQLVSYLDSLKP